MAEEHHRRLLAAMVESVARDGRGGATVSRVVELAGVSKATFYEHFRNRDDCFVAAYASAVEAVEHACRRSAQDGPEAALTAFLGMACAAPDLARLLLIESLGGPVEIRADYERMLRQVERAGAGGGTWQLQLPQGALHGGLTAVVAELLLRDEGDDLPRLLPGLVAWLRSYRVPAGAAALNECDWVELGRQNAVRLPGYALGPERADGIPPGRRRRLPRGRSAASPAQSAADRRQRLLEGTAEMVSLRGYAAASVAEIVSAAGVSRGAFYSHFSSKSEACLAVLTKNLQESVAAVASQFFLPDGWPDRVWTGLEAFLRYFGENPDAAYLGIVEIYAAGEAAIRRAEQHRWAFLLFLADGYRQSPDAKQMPSLCSKAIVGAIEGILRRQLLAGEGQRALELLPRCAYVALAPFIGSAAASEMAIAKAQEAQQEPGITVLPSPVPPVADETGLVVGPA